MDWIAISAIGDSLAAAGMIGSLIFVGLQIRSDRKATEYETTNRRQIGVRETFLAVATSDHLAPIMAKLAVGDAPPATQILVDEFDLEVEEAIRLNGLFTVMARQTSSTLQLPLSDQERAVIETAFIGGLNGPMGVWWEKGKVLFDPDFIADIERKRQQAAPAA